MQDVVAVCDLYRGELEEAVYGLSRRGLLTTRTTHTANSFRERTVKEESLKRGKDVTPNRAVVEIFLWTALMLLFSTIGSWAGSLISAAVTKEIAVAIAYFIVPATMLSTLIKHQRNHFEDVTIRFMLLSSAIVQGLIIGSIIDTKYFNDDPIAFVTPIAFAITHAATLKSVRGQQFGLQIACTSSALFANYVVGLLLGNLSSLYEMMALAYVSVNLATMQLVFRTVRESSEFALFMSFTILITLVLATSVKGQWGSIPMVNSGYNPLNAGGQIQPVGTMGGYYGSPLSNQPGANQLAAQFGPQFAQFGTQYQGYGGQSMPVHQPYGGQNTPNVQTLQQMLFPDQPRSVQQYANQPGAFGIQATAQGPFNQISYGGAQSIGYDQFQGDDFTGTVEKPASSTPPPGPIRVIPPFMKGQSKVDQDKFYAIVQHPTWSAAEKNAKIEELVRNMDVDVQNTFAQYQRATSGDLAVKQQRVHEAVASMSPEAQQQFQKVSALMTNPRIPEQERLQRIQNLYSNIPGTIKREFDSKFMNL